MQKLADTRIKVKINGKEYEAQKGEYIMDVARRNHILIPSFCHHEALAGQGCCRVCVVEVNEGGKPRVVVSCVYPLSKDCEVFTESDKIKGIRRTILSMLKDRAPEAKRIASLCSIYGVPVDKRYASLDAVSEETAAGHMDKTCILCGLCAEACSKLGSGAISTVGRGTGKKIATPYDEPSADCIGCTSCAAICPTTAIVYSEENGTRSIWEKNFNLAACEQCGRLFATKEELEHTAKCLAQSGDLEASAITICEDCRRKKNSDVMAAAFGIRAHS